jgi:hypothetical protein
MLEVLSKDHVQLCWGCKTETESSCPFHLGGNLRSTAVICTNYVGQTVWWLDRMPLVVKPFIFVSLFFAPYQDSYCSGPFSLPSPTSVRLFVGPPRMCGLFPLPSALSTSRLIETDYMDFFTFSDFFSCVGRNDDNGLVEVFIEIVSYGK